MSTDPHAPPGTSARDELRSLRSQWLLLLILGIGMVLTGVFAITSSFVATLATVTFAGTLLVIGAIMQVVNAVTCRNWRGFFVYLLGGVLYGVVGLMMMNHPVAAAAGLTLMIAASLLIGGILRIVIAAAERFGGWPWVLINGFISVALGVFIWRHLPETATWLIGTFVGIDLLFGGASWILLAFEVRSCASTE